MDKVLLIAEKHFGDALKNIISDRIVVTHLTYKEWRKKGFLSKILTLLRFKYIHHLGGTTSTTLIKSCRLLNKKLIIHFIGTDVYNILRAEMKDQHKIKKLYAKVWKLAAFGINLIEELKSVNIDNVEHIPFSANLKIPSETNKTPENSAITYLPEGSEEFYGWEFVKPLILKYPMVKFYILGNPGIEGFNKENAIFLGWIENVDDYIKKCKVYLRRTIHDGTPILIQQSLAYGRTVLFNHDFPHCRKFDEVEFEDAIYNWSFNQEGRDFIAREYSPEIISRRLISLYEIQ